MNLVKCNACGKEISPNASSCPHCGEPSMQANQGESSSGCGASGCGGAFLIGFSVIAIVLFVVALGGGGENESSPGPEHDKGMAWTMTQKFVKERLKSPSTAEFPYKSSLPNGSIVQDGRSYTIQGYVDSQNGFGATIRTDFTIEVRYTGNGKWRMLDLEFDE